MIATIDEPQTAAWLDGLPVVATGRVFTPEQNPFPTLMVDVTHRCNMSCNNCYLPNRSVPDMDPEWLAGILRRLPRRTRIRLVGAEPTVRQDLPELVRLVRDHGHIPALLTNGLRLADRAYTRELRDAGLRSIYLSFSGGFRDELYLAIDGMSCADKKIAALENLVAERASVTLGMILVRGHGITHAQEVYEHAKAVREIRSIHLRSIGAIGRHMAETKPFTLIELAEIGRQIFGPDVPANPACDTDGPQESCIEFQSAGMEIHLVCWPDLGSEVRGRLSPDGTIQPFFEHVIANDGGY